MNDQTWDISGDPFSGYKFVWKCGTLHGSGGPYYSLRKTHRRMRRSMAVAMEAHLQLNELNYAMLHKGMDQAG